MARQFARERLRPNVERWDHERAFDGDLIAELAELGFLGMTVPESHGGMALDLPAYAAAIEELAWGEPAVALIVARNATAADLLLRHGSDAQQRAWLERLASGEALACLASSEQASNASHDVRATAGGDGWRLDGTSAFVVNGGAAHLLILRARLETGGDGRASGAPGNERVSASEMLFLVRSDAPGYTVVEREATLGFRAADIVRISLNGVRLGEDAALGVGASLEVGEAGRGGSTGAAGAYVGDDFADRFAAATDLGRLSIAAIALGIAQAALDHAVAYANQREQFGEKLRAFEGIQLKLADMAIRVLAARALVAEATASPTRTRTAAAKVIASEAAMWVSTQAVQVFGGYGYMRDYPVEKLMRDAKGTELFEAANDDLRVLVTAELYRDA